MRKSRFTEEQIIGILQEVEKRAAARALQASKVSSGYVRRMRGLALRRR